MPRKQGQPGGQGRGQGRGQGAERKQSQTPSEGIATRGAQSGKKAGQKKSPEEGSRNENSPDQLPTNPLRSKPETQATKPTALQSAPPSAIMQRPQPPKTRMGSPIKLLVNHFSFMLVKQTIYQYAVEFKPECESKKVRYAILNEHKDSIGSTYIFDGAMLFTLEPISEAELLAHHSDRAITVSITPTRLLHPDAVGAPLQLYNMIFRKILRGLKLRQIGRQHFDPTHPIRIPQHKVELWPGYFTSINPNSMGMMLIADVTHKVLRTDTVLDFLYELSGSKNRQWKQLATQQLVGQVVLTRYNNRTYRIDDIDWSRNPGSTFIKRTGEKLSFFEYYASVYNKSLSEMEQPLLVHRQRRKGAEDEIIFLLPELCSMTGITEQMRNDFSVMRDIAEHTRVYPGTRAKGMLSFINAITNNTEIKQEFENWNITLDTKMLSVEGRVLPAETILFAGGIKSSYNPKTAEWSTLMKSSPLIHAEHVSSWILVFFNKNTAQANEFAEKLRQVGASVGLRVERPDMIQLDRDVPASYLEAIKAKLNPQTKCVVCILPSPRKDRYDAIKRLCCVELPVPSQCILAKSLSKRQTVMSVCNKIMLQINCKLGGELWNVPIPISNTMMIGIDVCHDTNNRDGRKSVAGFCASTNKNFTRYYSRVIFQGHGQELVSGLQICMKEALRAYFEKNEALPERIIVYRDGVGDGMLGAVVDHEVPQFLKTCQSIKESYRPKMAFVVVKKRIHTRLFLEQQQGELNNPPPGTVVDSGCVHPDWYDFFLVSQSVKQGTVTPSHYHVIVDNTGLAPDQMQTLTYKMCHLYYNWPGTIRVPAPCHYAHKIAFLVGQSLHEDPSLTLRDKLYFL